MDSLKYAKFDIVETTYKVVNNQDIKAYILTPKDITTGAHPLMIKFHGGFFITGDALYDEWYAQWALDYALLHSAIIITPNYRLLPEATGADIYSDIDDFWIWLRSSLQPLLAPGIKPDFTKVLAHGESAGGTLALYSGITQPAGSIRATISTYPTINAVAKRTQPLFGAPNLPLTILEEYLKAVEPGKIVTSAVPPARTPIILSIIQQERMVEFWGTGETSYLGKYLEKAADIPYELIFHGTDDTAVPAGESIGWVEDVEKKFGKGKVDLVLQPGEHGFDTTAGLETEWLKSGLEKVTSLWLAS